MPDVPNSDRRFPAFAVARTLILGAAAFSIVAGEPVVARMTMTMARTPARTATVTPAQTPVAAQVVQIRNFAFSPAVITVTVGTTVSWINGDDDPHTVTATDKTFHSGALDTKDKFQFRFTKVGQFAYFCSLHPHMTGKVIVKPS